MEKPPGDHGRKTRSTPRAQVRAIELHRGRYRWKPRIEGKRVIVTLAATTYDDAVAEVLRIRKQGIASLASDWEQTVRAYLLALHKGGKLSPTTQENRLRILLAAGRDAGCTHVRQLTPIKAQAWLDKTLANESLTQTTRHDYVRFFRTFVKWCVSERLLLTDPTDGWTRSTAQPILRNVFIPAAEVARLLQHAREKGDRDIEWILALGCECGMRRGEICAARPEWFDLTAGTLTIPAVDGDWARKGREGRRKEAVIPLSNVMLEIISRHGLPSPYIVAPHKTAPATWRYRFEFRRRFTSFLKQYGYGHVTIHDLRRSFASNRVSSGVSIEKVANWLGIHRNTAWTRYSRFIPRDEEINRGSAIAAPAAASSPVPAKVGDTIAQRLATVDQLHASGLITDEERAAKRAAILAEI